MTHRRTVSLLRGLGALAVVGLLVPAARPAHAAQLFVTQAGLGAQPDGTPSRATIDTAVAKDLTTTPRAVVLDDVPLPDGRKASFQMEPLDVFAPGAKVVEFDGASERAIDRPDMTVYAGTEVGGGSRDAVVSIVEGRAVWALVRQNGQVVGVIQPLDDTGTGAHTVVGPSDMPLLDRKLCDGNLAAPGAALRIAQTTGATAPSSATGPTLSTDVLVDIGFDTYRDAFDSNATTATQYAVNLVGAVSTIYRRDMNIAVRISQMVVWTAADPFAGPDSLTQLNAYKSWNQANRSGVSRDTAHLLAHVTTAGGRAYLDALCSTSIGYGVSNIYGNLVTFPTAGNYMWDVMVVAHELGHNFGSRHTHCYSPPLDHCYNQEAGCYAGPVETTVGEIMSYCHLVQTIDLHFGGTVGGVVRAGAEAGFCIGNDALCGNGTLDPGEQCDDGNAVDGDCCATNCVVELNQPCASDGDPCTSDFCSTAGTCVHAPPGSCGPCAAPTVMPPGGGTLNGFIAGTNVIHGTCGGGGPEQVFEWTPALSGTASATTCGSPTDTVLYVREGTCDLGVQRGCNDDSCGVASVVNFASVAGRTYFIVVDGYYSSSASAAFVLNVAPGTCGNGTTDAGEQCDDGNTADGDCCSATCTFETTACTDDGDLCTTDVCGGGTCTHVPPGICNACSIPTTIPAAGGTFSGTTTGASTLTGCGAQSNGAERVYEWTPVSTGVANISTCGGTTNYDTVLSVRSAGCASTLACSDDACGTASSIALAVTAGQTYDIVVDGYSGNGNYTLTVTPPVICGDGVVAGSEECDDGNTVPNDGCTDLCTICSNGVRSTPEECDDGNLVDGDGCSASCRLACPPTPLAGCRLPTLPRKSVVKLKQGTLDSKDVFGWKWGSGAGITKAELGNPLATDSYLLCLYDVNGFAFGTFAPAGGSCAGRPCWADKPTGFKYVDKDLTPRGVSKIDLKEGLVDGKAKAGVKGKGDLLGLPDTSALTSPVRIQLFRPGGPCLEGVFSAPFLKQDATQFKDVSD